MHHYDFKLDMYYYICYSHLEKVSCFLHNLEWIYTVDFDKQNHIETQYCCKRLIIKYIIKFYARQIQFTKLSLYGTITIIYKTQ